MADKIVLQNMMFYGFHGVYEYEREQGQRFYIDVELITDLTGAAQTDELDDTLDYTELYCKVKDIVENKKFKLLEALAGNIAHTLLSVDVINEVTVKVRKPSVPLHGQIDFVQVQITRGRK